MRFAVREAGISDAAAIVALVRRFNVEEGNPPGVLTVEELSRIAFGEQPRFGALVAESRGDVVGYAVFFRSYDTEHAAKGLYLQDLYIVPEARGQGIGRALMTAVARACLADEGCYLFWNARQGNRDGRAFYRAIGAREEPVVTLSLQPDALRHLAERG
jgi:GNAT superfamily N-acetyltransferase